MEEQTKFEIEKVMRVTQLPKIYYQLEEIGKRIDEQLDGIYDMVCTEENKVEVKNRRAEINALNNAMETKRKEIKKEILKDYDLFNEKYEQEVKSKLINASSILTNKIDEIENKQKEIGTNNIKRYFEELRESLHLENIIQFEDLNLNITLTNLGKTLEGKKYKEEIKQRLDSIANDINLINLEEYKEEILLEYKTNFDFAKSKLVVINRHNQINELKQQQEKVQEQVEQEQKIEEKVEEIIAPIEIKENEEVEEIIESTFTVKGTLKQLKLLKEFLEKEGIYYE